MLSFHEPEISDRKWVSDILLNADTFGCEYTFGNIYIWCKVYQTKITKFQDFFLSKYSGEDKTVYAFPMGNGNIKDVLDEVIRDAENDGKPFAFFNANKKSIDILNEYYPARFSFTYRRDSSDYIYKTSDLAELPGKKYHAKRNHISAFEKGNNWSYESINGNNLSECYEMNEKWEQENADRNIEGLNSEKSAIDRAFDRFFDLGLSGGIIRADGEIVAYSVGEPINDRVFCVHFEKAYADIRGAYPIINREFVHHTMTAYEYVNREEDLGLEGLRKAKLSYNPVFLNDKYFALSLGLV